jgi:hypothetical protein
MSYLLIEAIFKPIKRKAVRMKVNDQRHPYKGAKLTSCTNSLNKAQTIALIFRSYSSLIHLSKLQNVRYGNIQHQDQ